MSRSCEIFDQALTDVDLLVRGLGGHDRRATSLGLVAEFPRSSEAERIGPHPFSPRDFRCGGYSSARRLNIFGLSQGLVGTNNPGGTWLVAIDSGKTAVFGKWKSRLSVRVCPLRLRFDPAVRASRTAPERRRDKFFLGEL
jgi:hypothetical protein